MLSFTDECKDVLDELNISNNHELSKYQRKRLAKSHITFVETDTYKLQSYHSELNVLEARMCFKIATNMVPAVQMNFKPTQPSQLTSGPVLGVGVLMTPRSIF